MPITILTNELKVKNNDSYMSFNTMADLAAESPLSKLELFDTVAAMKAAVGLHVGMFAQTAGYYSVNDGGGALYRIKSSAPSTYYERLNNNLYAELIITEVMTPIQFGAKGDGTTNDAPSLQAAVTYANILECLGLHYSVLSTEKLFQQENYMGIIIRKGIKIKNGYFKMAPNDDTYGLCVFVIDTGGGIVEFESVTIDGNIDSQGTITTENANHGIAISRLGTAGVVKLNNCLIKKCRTDAIMHRCGFLELRNCTIINSCRNGITCDRDAFISHCIFDSSEAKKSPKASIYHEPNENYGFKNIRITIEHCGFNGYNWDGTEQQDDNDEAALEPNNEEEETPTTEELPNGGITLFAADTQSEIRRVIVQNCYSTNQYKWKCSVIAADGQIYDIIIRNNTDMKLICGHRPINTGEHPLSYMDTLVIDNNQRSVYTIGTTASRGPINRVQVSNFDTANQKFSIHCVIGELIIENGEFNGWADNDENKGNLLQFYTAAWIPDKLIIRNCNFKNGKSGIFIDDNTSAARLGEIISVENCTFTNISTSACIKSAFFKKIYLNNLYSENCEAFFITAGSNNHILMASNCIFCQPEANNNTNTAFKNCQNVHASNCVYSYTIPS